MGSKHPPKNPIFTRRKLTIQSLSRKADLKNKKARSVKIGLFK